MQNNNFQELLDKYLTGSMSEQEWTIFKELLHEPEHKKQLEAIIDAELETHAFEGVPDNNTLAAIQDHLRTNIQAEKERSQKIVYYIKRLAVAAVFVLVLGGIGWWVASRKASEHEVAQVNATKKGTTITPGGNKAILKLSDGTEIILDSAGEGTLAQQGQAKVIKLKEGELKYESTIDNRQSAIVYNTLTTPRGGQYQIVLPDGSKVWLNAASSIRYPTAFIGNERKVEITGEAYFEVAKNANKPFMVHFASAGREGEVEVLGTHFNVNAYEDEPAVKTTLLEGIVKVENQSAIGNRQSAILKPGEQVSISQSSHLSQPIPVQTEEVMAWKNGLFQFKGADIATVLRQTARWYDVQFDIKENVSTRFSGQISRSANIEQLLKILELTGKVKFEIHGKTIIVKE
jgi:transmembrane sensor